MLSDGNGLCIRQTVISYTKILRAYLLDQHVEIFWDFGCKTYVTLSVSWTNSEAVVCQERLKEILDVDADADFSGRSELRSMHTIGLEDSQDFVACAKVNNFVMSNSTASFSYQ
jgi:hypothetical protein